MDYYQLSNNGDNPSVSIHAASTSIATHRALQTSMGSQVPQHFKTIDHSHRPPHRPTMTTTGLGKLIPASQWYELNLDSRGSDKMIELKYCETHPRAGYTPALVAPPPALLAAPKVKTNASITTITTNRPLSLPLKPTFPQGVLSNERAKMIRKQKMPPQRWKPAYDKEIGRGFRRSVNA